MAFGRSHVNTFVYIHECVPGRKNEDAAYLSGLSGLRGRGREERDALDWRNAGLVYLAILLSGLFRCLNQRNQTNKTDKQSADGV